MGSGRMGAQAEGAEGAQTPTGGTGTSEFSENYKGFSQPWQQEDEL